jgi:hypothetical protein
VAVRCETGCVSVSQCEHYSHPCSISRSEPYITSLPANVTTLQAALIKSVRPPAGAGCGRLRRSVLAWRSPRGMGLSDEYCSQGNCAPIQRHLGVPEPVQRRRAHLCSSWSGRRTMARQTKSPRRCHKACELAPTQSVSLLSASEDLPDFSRSGRWSRKAPPRIANACLRLAVSVRYNGVAGANLSSQHARADELRIDLQIVLSHAGRSEPVFEAPSHYSTI